MRAIAYAWAFVATVAVVQAHATGPENRVLWFDPDDDAQFVTALKEHGVPFHRDADGGIWYPASRVHTVDEISLVVRERCSPATNFEDPKDAAQFAERLKQAGISFSMCRHFGKQYFKWDPKAEARVTAIREAIEDESLQRLQGERNRIHQESKKHDF